jgi:hypothetical protein
MLLPSISSTRRRDGRRRQGEGPLSPTFGADHFYSTLADNPPEGRIKVRLIKMFGLAAIAAVAAMAFVGASSAMASGSTAACKVATEPCPAGSEVTTLHGVSAAEPTLLTTSEAIPDVKCLSGLVKVNVLALGNPQVGHFEEINWNHCYATSIGNPLCEVETKLLGLALLLKTAANLGTVTIDNASVLVKCTTVIHCTYKVAAGQTLHAQGAAGESNGHVTANNVSVAQDTAHTGTICPASTWDSLYTALEATFIST